MKSKFCKITLAILILLTFKLSGKTQICDSVYTVISEMSGIDINPYQNDLNNAACELKQVFPDQFQEQFKVYDFGFYSQNEFMNNDSKIIWDKVISEIPTDYYLLFGKITDQTGVHTKFWFDIKLPDIWLNQCYDESYISMLKTSIIFNFEQINYDATTKSYASYEIECMNYLKGKIQELTNCCQPGFASEELCDGCITEPDVDEFFINNGFDTLTIEIINPDTTILEYCLCQTEGISLLNKRNSKFKRSGSFIDYTDGYIINLNGTELNLSNKANQIIDNYQSSYGIITHSLNYCQEDFYSLMSSFSSSNIAFWFHVSGDKLYLKSKGIGDRIKIGSCSAQHVDQLQCILDKFESSGANLFTEIFNTFDGSKKDIIINVDCPPSNSTAQGETIDELLGRLGIVEIYLNPDRFEIIEDYPLKAAQTIIHEMCHGLMSLNVLKANGPQNCTWLDYNYYYSIYGNVSQTDECIMARYFIDKQAKLLWQYNNKHMEPKHYLLSAWGPYFGAYKGCKSIVPYTRVEMQNLYLEMRDSNPNPFPCLSN